MLERDGDEVARAFPWALAAGREDSTTVGTTGETIMTMTDRIHS
jgi:hypothetical protein